MNAQRVVSLVLLSSVMVSGICFGAPLLTFFDATSFALFIGVVGGGILWSHSLSDVTAAFGTFLGSSTVDPEQSQRLQVTTGDRLHGWNARTPLSAAVRAVPHQRCGVRGQPARPSEDRWPSR